MANPKTLVSSLAEEVADILRHDNLDARIYEWLGMAFNDIVLRVPMSLFHKLETLTITSGAAFGAVTIPPGVLSFAVFRGANDVIYLPKQLSLTDFQRLKASSGAIADSNIPLAFCISSDGSGGSRLQVFPGAAQNLFVTLLSMSQSMDSVPVGTDYLHLPYHFEHVLVWGAAAIGAQMLRSQTASLCASEYESALQEMTMLMVYMPDATPSMRSVGGVYAGTGRLKGMPRVPDTING